MLSAHFKYNLSNDTNKLNSILDRVESIYGSDNLN